MTTVTALAIAALLFLLAALAMRQRAMERHEESPYQNAWVGPGHSLLMAAPAPPAPGSQAADPALELAMKIAERRAWQVAMDLAEQRDQALGK